MATEEDKTNTGALGTLVAVGAFAMIGICLAVTAVTRDELAQAGGAREGTGTRPYYEMRAEQKQKLSTGMPIEQAMHQVVSTLQRDPMSATAPAPKPIAIPTDNPAAAGEGGPTAAPAPSAAPAQGAAPGAAAPAPSAAHAPNGVPATATPSAAPASSAAPKLEKKKAPAASVPAAPAPAAPVPAPAAPGSAHG